MTQVAGLVKGRQIRPATIEKRNLLPEAAVTDNEYVLLGQVKALLAHFNTGNKGVTGVAATSGQLVTTLAQTPSDTAFFTISLRGVALWIGDGVKEGAGYFSRDNGQTALSLSAIVAGDGFYWNAPYPLATDDTLDFHHLVGGTGIGVGSPSTGGTTINGISDVPGLVAALAGKLTSAQVVAMLDLYYDKTAADARFIDNSELSLALSDYITQTLADSTYATKSEVTTGLGGKENTGVAAALVDALKAGSSETIASLKGLIDTLTSLFNDNTADGDSIVNTIQEILAIFATYPEGVDIATTLAGKVNAGDLAAYATKAYVQTHIGGRTEADYQIVTDRGNENAPVMEYIQFVYDVVNQAGTLLDSKVDKVTGQRLISANEIAKLSGIEDGAEVNVNADWNATSGDAKILNKPSLATVATTGAYADLSGKPTIPAVAPTTGMDTVLVASDLTLYDPTGYTSDTVVGIVTFGSGINRTKAYIDAADALKVDKVAGERLIDAGEITKLSNTSGTNTGDETASTIRTKVGDATTSVSGLLSATDKTKLNGIATGATANDTDANLKARANHTGTQSVSTITGLGDSATKNTGTIAGTVAAGDHTHAATNASINSQSTSYSTVAGDLGSVISYTGATAVNHTVSQRSTGFNHLVVQEGAGQVTFVAGSGVTLVQADSYTKTKGVGAVVSLLWLSATKCVLGGNMA